MELQHVTDLLHPDVGRKCVGYLGMQVDEGVKGLARQPEDLHVSGGPNGGGAGRSHHEGSLPEHGAGFESVEHDVNVIAPDDDPGTARCQDEEAVGFITSAHDLV